MSEAHAAAAEPNPPLGEHKRDRQIAWRALATILGGLAVIFLGVLTFSAEAYVQKKAGEVVTEAVTPLADLPPRVRRLEEISKERTELMRLNAAHDAQVDVILSRLTGLVETQQKQLDRQQAQMDRLEQFIRERGRE